MLHATGIEAQQHALFLPMHVSASQSILQDTGLRDSLSSRISPNEVNLKATIRVDTRRASGSGRPGKEGLEVMPSLDAFEQQAMQASQSRKAEAPCKALTLCCLLNGQY